MKIILRDISYSYKKKDALKNINLKFDQNHKCTAIVGHNGAGKSTLLNILCGIFKTYDGSLEISPDIRISYLPFDNLVYDNLTVEENIEFWYQVSNNKFFDINNKKVKFVLEQFKLDELMHFKAVELSSGKQKLLSLACILLGNANVIILDEPFNGLDFITINTLCDIIKHYMEQNTHFIIASHQIETLSTLYDRSLILENGYIIYDSILDQKGERELSKVYSSIYNDS